MKAEGPVMQYCSTDMGSEHYLKRLTPPTTLILKRRCPVILLKNVSDKLVNGTLGTVVNLNEDGPLIHFEYEDTAIQMKRESFTGMS